MSVDVTSINDGIADGIANARRSLVRIVSRGHGVGSGVAWGGDGLVVTNAHVVERSAVEVIAAGGERVRGRVVAMDEGADVAFVATDAEIEPARVRDAREVRAGELAFAMGYPWGIAEAVSSGVVIGVGDEWMTGRDRRDWLALNMRLRPGNSGGPVFDAEGRLIGLSTIMAGPDVGLAVPSHVVAAVARMALTPAIV
jgi:S1-C subfamily serine protease